MRDDDIKEYATFRNSHDDVPGLAVELWYPRADDRPKFIEVGLVDVRAADDIRISYDFDRDGWKIEQASCFSWSIDDETCDPDWKEVAFVKAWGRKQTA